MTDCSLTSDCFFSEQVRQREVIYALNEVCRKNEESLYCEFMKAHRRERDNMIEKEEEEEEGGGEMKNVD